MTFLSDTFLNPQFVDELKQVLETVPDANTKTVALDAIQNNPILTQLCNTEDSAFYSFGKHLQKVLSSGDYLTRIDFKQLPELPFFLTNIATIIICLAGNPFLLYDKEPYWEELTVKLDVRAQGMHGQGANTYHMDLMTNENPPNIIAFLGVRADPLGGGWTELSNVYTAIDQLESSERSLLRRPIYRYWLDNPPPAHVGKPMSRFAIDDQTYHCVRFTAKAIHHYVAESENLEHVLMPEAFDLVDDIHAVMSKLFDILQSQTTRFLVDRNHLALFNQRILLHARTPLGNGQENVAVDDRRLLLQGYANLPTST